MKKIGIIISTAGLAIFSSISPQAFMAEAAICEPLRSEYNKKKNKKM